MARRREIVGFSLLLGVLVGAVFHESLFGGKVLSPGDVVLASASFSAEASPGDYEPANRLLMDPVLQFEPWREFSSRELRAGRLPLWNPLAGCGAPHLANGQSAVFDPFHLIAYLGTLPAAIGWMSAARLWVAGLGMFLLASSWGLSPLGRWFAGLAFPFCGFLMVWLLYPVTSVAVWMPWLFLAGDRALEGRRFAIAGLATMVGLVLLSGHIQTSAHVLLASGVYTIWRTVVAKKRTRWREISRWSLGIVLGMSLGAIEVVPLASYLSKSPVWADRRAEKPSIMSVSRPRVLDAATTGLPYLFGSQRRGHPNLAKALGVHNLNESAGGFAGLATLFWLAPAAWSARSRHPRITFLFGLGIFATLGAFNVPPVPNLLRIVPVLDVADNRRLTLWLAFALVLLGGYGLDATTQTIVTRRWKIWTRLWLVFAAVLAIAASGIVAFGPRIREKSIAHYAKLSQETPGADPSIYRRRAERQARLATTFLPRYLLIEAGHLVVLAGLAEGLRRRRDSPRFVQAALVVLVFTDLIAFGYGLNPAIPSAQNRPNSAVIAYLKREVQPPWRIISVGAELPPNLLMRYGLADARNYDSIELSRNLDWFADLYEPEPDRPSTRTSRRTITWDGVARSIGRLKIAGVGAIVGATPPPDFALFSRVDRVGRVWIARLDSAGFRGIRVSPGEIRVDLTADNGQVGWVAETFDPGWTVEVDGRHASTLAYRGAFLGVRKQEGSRLATFRYEPIEVKIGGLFSLFAGAVILMLLGIGLTARKTADESWNPVCRPVRMELDIIARPLLPGSPSTEGRDADGPLHV